MSKIMIDKNEAQYYDLDGPIIACIGVMASIAMFKLTTLPEGQSGWELVPDNSSQYDSYHQSIYRNFRVSLLELDEIERLPDLPLQICSKLETKEEVDTLNNSLSASDYKSLAALLGKQTDNEFQVYAVLKEDLYETHHGDGCYRYLNAVFLEKLDAQNLITKINSDENYRGHLRDMKLRLKQERIEVLDLNLDIFDCCDFKEVLELLDQRYDSSNSITNVEGLSMGIPHRLFDQYDGGGVSPTKEEILELLKAAPPEVQSRVKVFEDEKRKAKKFK